VACYICIRLWCLQSLRFSLIDASTVIPTAVTFRPDQGSVAVVDDQSTTASQIGHCWECYDNYCDCYITAMTVLVTAVTVLVTTVTVPVTTVTVLVTTVTVLVTAVTVLVTTVTVLVIIASAWLPCFCPVTTVPGSSPVPFLRACKPGSATASPPAPRHWFRRV